MLSAGVIAGAVMGVLSNLPVLWMGNCLACLWLWASGIFGAWLYRRSAGLASLVPSTGAVVGGLAGLVGAVIRTLLGTVFNGVGLVNLFSGLFGNPDTASAFGNVAGGITTAVMIGVISLVFNTVIYAVFGAIGGGIGAVIFGARPAPSVAVPVPNPAPTPGPTTGGEKLVCA